MLFALSILVFSIGFISLMKYAYTMMWGKSTETWLDQPAEILTSELKTKTFFGKTWYWIPVITYTYAVDNHRYESNSVSHGRSPWLCFGRKNFAFFTSANLINKYPAGQTAITYYNPDSPDLSILERGTNPENNIFLGVAITCFIVGIIAIIFS